MMLAEGGLFWDLSHLMNVSDSDGQVEKRKVAPSAKA